MQVPKHYHIWRNDKKEMVFSTKINKSIWIIDHQSHRRNVFFRLILNYNEMFIFCYKTIGFFYCVFLISQSTSSFCYCLVYRSIFVFNSEVIRNHVFQVLSCNHPTQYQYCHLQSIQHVYGRYIHSYLLRYGRNLPNLFQCHRLLRIVIVIAHIEHKKF